MEKQTVKTSSVNTIKAWEVLKESGQEMTLKDIADEMGVATNKILGGITSMVKKGLIERGEEVQVEDKTYKTFKAGDVEVEFDLTEGGEKKQLSDGAIQLLEHFKANPDLEATYAETAEALGKEKAIQVTAFARSLISRDLMKQETCEVEMPDGKVKELKIISITEKGKSFQY